MKQLAHHLKNSLGLIMLIASLLIFNYIFDIYIVLTGSMEPVLMTGAVTVVNCMDTSPGPGDIAAYKNGSNIVIHRVISFDSSGYTFKGDSNPDEDPYKIKSADIVGTVILKINFIAPLIQEYFL